MKKAYFNWSSGKDSAFALYKAMKSETYDVQNLFTIIKKQGSKIAMHEIGIDLLKQQANAIGIPLTVLEFDLAASSDEYEKSIKTQMEKFKGEQINTALFGGLYLQDLRNRRIEKCKQQGIQAEFTLWNSKPDELLREFISLGFKSIVTCVDGSVLDESFVGRVIDEAFLRDLPSGIDICGENGEYHSFVFDGPIFHKPVKFEIIKRYYIDYPNETNTQQNRYWYLELR
ncbi:MAG: diphthine--ammonia ligase [Ruminococcus sp.]|jgi:uncharacterized protein (TIGR00290 family)|nr:diphthine--ammonia ligase [Ruminococcus sp.]